jgi:hypothetical protein
MTANTPKSRKAKGRILQTEIAYQIAISIPGIGSEDVKPAIMGESGMDIKLSSRARDLFPYAIEAKAQESLNIWQALEQARINAEKEKLMPLLVFKRNRSDVYVCLRFADFLQLVTKGVINH